MLNKKPFNNVLFILQPVDLCNLNCSYCYLPGRRNPAKISLDLCKKIAEKISNTKICETATVSWHAGEPLTVGTAFFRKMLACFHNTPSHIKIQQSVQTNGTLINNAWIDLFQEFQVNIGISVDGPAHIHDIHRVNWKNKGSHAQVQKAITLLKERNVRFTGIAVVTHYSLDYPDEIFYYFLNNNFESFGLSVENIEAHNSTSTFSRSELSQSDVFHKYQKFMTRMLELWFMHKDKIRIREFSKFLKINAYTDLSNKPPRLSEAEPLKIISIDKEGYLYTFSPELVSLPKEYNANFVFGHIDEINDFDDILKSRKLIETHAQIQKGRQMCEETCGYFNRCGGGTPASKFFENNTFESTETYACLLKQKLLNDLLAKYLA